MDPNISPAYPVQETDAHGQVRHCHLGISKRELLAAMALQGLLASDHAATLTPQAAASLALENALALLERLEQPL